MFLLIWQERTPGQVSSSNTTNSVSHQTNGPVFWLKSLQPRGEQSRAGSWSSPWGLLPPTDRYVQNQTGWNTSPVDRNTWGCSSCFDKQTCTSAAEKPGWCLMILQASPGLFAPLLFNKFRFSAADMPPTWPAGLAISIKSRSWSGLFHLLKKLMLHLIINVICGTQMLPQDNCLGFIRA